MRESAIELAGNFSKRDLMMKTLCFITNKDIWLALDDNHDDSRRHDSGEPLGWDLVTATELLLYHQQLFNWLLIRSGSCLLNMNIETEQRPLMDFNIRN
jgi:hypothetical protein